MARDDGTGRREHARQGVILVVDDHELIRRSVAQLLEREFPSSKVREASSFDEALALSADPDVFLAIVDLTMPGLGSPHELAKLRTLRPEVRVIVLSGSEERSDIIAALTAGVHGYIVKSERSETLLRRIRQVLDGEIYVPASIADLPADAPRPAVAAEALPIDADVLTRRQREVLQLITAGMSNKEIGRELKVAEGTVKMHVATILKAIGANNRAHAAAIGRKFISAAP